MWWNLFNCRRFIAVLLCRLIDLKSCVISCNIRQYTENILPSHCGFFYRFSGHSVHCSLEELFRFLHIDFSLLVMRIIVSSIVRAFSIAPCQRWIMIWLCSHYYHSAEGGGEKNKTPSCLYSFNQSRSSRPTMQWRCPSKKIQNLFFSSIFTLPLSIKCPLPCIENTTNQIRTVRDVRQLCDFTTQIFIRSCQFQPYCSRFLARVLWKKHIKPEAEEREDAWTCGR